ncbi:MAG TPA: pyridoxamine 5'-phosphate oxidase family protein [Polyangia bacterium]|nr:pyridoxamine 5'-phosphate oxidase family protein [Polyangia bacterium]
MRREQHFRMERDEAVAMLAAAPFVHLAAAAPDGTPILKTVHGVIVDGAICFHGAPAGEKMEAIGRPVVVSCEEVVAEVPSYFTDAERACPATTLYRSVQVHGVLELVEDAAEKARALQALMERFQPEGGHAPIAHDHPLYRAAVRGILIARVPLERLDGKSKLAQNRSPDEVRGLLEKLWARGRGGDAAAIERLRAANPSAPAPAFLVGPEGARLCCALQQKDAPAAAALLEGCYWNCGVERARLERAQLGAAAWVGAHDGGGALIASARAISDGARLAWIHDVVVAPAWRGRGLGRALLRLLLDHPSVRGARQVRLATRDAQGLYRKLGFVDYAAAAGEPQMILERG